MKRKRNTTDVFEGHCDELEDSYHDNSFNSTKIIEAVAGKLETLQMTNFMCHSNLEVFFNTRVNFITGNNGSGKSAIMAAFIVVLGGSAALTGRGSLISDFIKKGENWAKVSITLINEGFKSYKKDIYGSRITIVRNLSKSSGNSYICKSETGAVISKKKEEVDNIILAFNLQLKNPICVLNQDVARSFLCSTDSSLRFNMFMKATQLEDLKTIYMKTLELLLVAKKQLQTKERGIEEASQEISKLREKLELFASLEKYIKKKTTLENEFLWSLVVDEENKLKQLIERKSYFENEKQKFSHEEGNFENVIKVLETEIKKCQKTVEQVKSSLSDKTKEKSGMQREVQNFDRELEKLEVHLKHFMLKKERKIEEIEGVKECLQQKDAVEIQSQAEKDKSNKQINYLEENLSKIKDEVVDIQRELRSAHNKKFQLSKTVENIIIDLGELEQNKKRLEILLAGTKTKGQLNMMKYGQHTLELLEGIEKAAKENQFQKKPVGPCGMYVTLSGDPKWARAVESVIGELMTSYCCDNQEDCQVLTRVMDKVCGGRQPPIIISKFHLQRHDVESQKVSFRGLHSVLDVLKFNNDIVFNTFIDQARIETILLFETDSQAAAILTHIQNVPKNLRMGLTLKSDQYFPAPNYRTYYGDSERPLKYFEGLAKGNEDVKKLESELRETCKEVQEKSAEITKTKQDFLNISRSLEESENKMKQLKQKEKKFQLKLNQLRDIEDSRPVVKTKVVLEEELLSLEQSFKELSEKTSKCQESLKTFKSKKINFETKFNSLVVDESNLEKELALAEQKLAEKKMEYRQLLGKRQGSNDQLVEINSKLKEIRKEIQKSEETIKEKIKVAEDVCSERIKTTRSPLEVQKLLEKCEKYLEAAEKITGSKEATVTEYKGKLELFKNMKKVAALLKNSIEKLTRVAFDRENRLSIQQSHMASMVSIYFQAILQTRGYDGQLKVDFENKVLNIEVKPKDATIVRKDSKTLSGGERSYSTVSFILAIWKVVNMPVYFMDEFDVFMDKINRKAIMDLLLEHATTQSKEQFIFITPQDVSNVQTSDVISVWRLPDPKRKNMKLETKLDFEAFVIRYNLSENLFSYISLGCQSF